MSGKIQINETLSVESQWQGDKLVLRIVRIDAGIVTIRPGEINDLFRALTDLAARAAADAAGGDTEGGASCGAGQH